MQKNTKIILGLAGAGVLAYLLWKNSKKTSASPEVSSEKCQKRLGEFGVECNDGSCDVSNGVVMPCEGKGGVKGSTSDLPYMIKDGAVVNGKKWTIKSQADCPAGYNFSSPPPFPCTPGSKLCDSGGPRCIKIETVTRGKFPHTIRGCSQGQMPCPDDSGCFDPFLDPISNWEAGKPHPCNRYKINPKILTDGYAGY